MNKNDLIGQVKRICDKKYIVLFEKGILDIMCKSIIRDHVIIFCEKGTAY